VYQWSSLVRSVLVSSTCTLCVIGVERGQSDRGQSERWQSERARPTAHIYGTRTGTRKYLVGGTNFGRTFLELGCDMCRLVHVRRWKNTTSGLVGPEVVFYERPWPIWPTARPQQAIRRQYRPKYGQNECPWGAGGQTGSGNMAATRCFDFVSILRTTSTSWTGRKAIRTRYMQFRARSTSKEYYFRLTWPEVVFCGGPWPIWPTARTQPAIRRSYSPKYRENERPGALEAKPEVEIWRRPDISTFWPRLPIRPPIHYGSISNRYGATNVKTLTLRHCKL